METKHGTSQAGSRRLLAGFAVLLLAAMFTFTLAGCPEAGASSAKKCPGSGNCKGTVMGMPSNQYVSKQNSCGDAGCVVEKVTGPGQSSGATFSCDCKK